MTSAAMLQSRNRQPEMCPPSSTTLVLPAPRESFPSTKARKTSATQTIAGCRSLGSKQLYSAFKTDRRPRVMNAHCTRQVLRRSVDRHPRPLLRDTGAAGPIRRRLMRSKRIITLSESGRAQGPPTPSASGTCGEVTSAASTRIRRSAGVDDLTPQSRLRGGEGV